MKEDCGTLYDELNRDSKTFILMLIIIGVAFIIRLIVFRARGGDIRSYLKANLVREILYFSVLIILIGACIFTGIKVNDYKNKEECANYYKY